MDEKCSHLGAWPSLLRGDIEGAGSHEGHHCIVCQWHKWCYNLHTGHSTFKLDASRTEMLHLYQVRKGDGGEIRVGLESLGQFFFD